MNTERRSFALDTRSAVATSENTNLGRTVTGVLLRYNTDYPVGEYMERWEPRAFGDLTDKKILANLQHDRGKPIAVSGRSLFMTESPDGLEMRLNLDSSLMYAGEAIRMLEAGLLTGYSVEFLAEDESFSGKTRTIRSARMMGVGLVDTPQYASSTAHLRWKKQGSSPEKRILWLRCS